MTLWSSSEIAKATGGKASAEFDAHGVAFDSREIAPGDLFLAMRGESDDGHRFLEAAFANGAVGAVVEQDCDHPHVRVPDSGRALEDLARAARSRSEAVIIGVTGSAGKTGTKEALYQALNRSSRGKAHRSLKSYNNHVGVPLSMARMPADTRFGIFEMGMNHTGELAVLTRLARPHIAIVTTVAPAHIGYFSGEEEIADAKAEIFEGLVEGGTAILPRDNPHYERLAKAASGYAANIVTFGFHTDADVRALDSVAAMSGGSLVTAQLRTAKLCYTVSQPGDHWVANSLAVLAAVEAAGGDLASAGLALAELAGMPGRGARHRITVGNGSAELIDESYNANPASMAVTLAGLGKQRARRRIAVLGTMGELGEASERYHAALAGPVQEASIDWVILVGAEMKILGESLSNSLETGPKTDHVATADDAIALVRDALQDGDAVLVKGSNYLGLKAVVDALARGED